MVYDAMVVAQQRKQLLFLDEGTGDIAFRYEYNGSKFHLGYMTGLKHTILRELLDFTQQGTPLELQYSFRGTKNTTGLQLG
mmetsp:Transcript_41751/g.46524  ORF Transcript_41751/g.46524 Transcript_41751/m.46524 type:complete len:81 (+) Transcript_41751:137-379(+)